MTKICKTCNIEKSLELFKKEKRRPDGRASYCKKCHNVSSRLSYSKNLEKERQRSRDYRKNNPEKRKEITRNYREANKEKIKLSSAKYSKKNREKITQRTRELRKANPERYQDNRRAYEAAHIGERRATTAKYRAKKLQATPAWADLDAIKEFYKNCPPGHEVDHIIPLQGKYVSGLHVENNLQYLPAHENKRKGNKFEG
jgi:hypothetical protein